MCNRFAVFLVMVFIVIAPAILLADTVSALDPRTSNILGDFYSQPGSDMLAGNSEKWVTVEARSDLSAGVVVARRSAMLAAYRKALDESPFSEKEMSHWRNFKDVVSILSRQKKTVVKRFEILGGGVDQENEKFYRIRMKALVVDMFGTELGDDDSLVHFLDLIVEPRVLLLLSDSEKPQDVSSVGSSANSEIFIARKLKKVGYTVLTSKDVKKAVGETDFKKAKEGDAGYAAHVGRLLNADLVLTGNFHFTSFYDKPKKQQRDLCCNSYVFKWKAVLPGSGREVYVETRKEHKSTGGNEERDRHIGMVSAIEKISNDLKWEILNVLSSQTHDISVVINNVTHTRADSIRRIFANLEGVEKVEMKGWDEKGTRYIVRNVYTGPREQDLSEILSKSFKSLQLRSVGNDELVMSF